MEQTQTKNITKDMIISDILVQNHEKANLIVGLMMEFGIHCIGCGASTFETLEQGVLGHGFSEEELEQLIKELNNIIGSKETNQENKSYQEFQISFTESAINKIKEVMKKEGKDFENSTLRVAILGGGCSGFMYDLEITENYNPSDLKMKYGEINLVIEKNSLEHLNGIEIDFVDTLKESGFKFNNPNAKKSCGCGKSFR